ncbi:type I-E CRISPR-associated protein Cse2/CasB [Marinimicrococcus flavescens]|uniref:Type I-E CRISPR-associated protein Cse2/CasB n=1 Tax=Marinimicrococcus flavescens TaxID=3031815 RepID=A0AAP3XRD1_9PROT|nr:hypothetical protein [Marinimicrococcus flavescens]
MPDERTDWNALIAAAARRLARDDYPGGSLAELRRLRPAAPDGAAFWRLVAQLAPGLFDEERGQRVLAAVLRGMACAHPFHLPAGGRRSLGTAMAEADVAEARLLRLLRLDEAALPEELRRLARLMAAKGDAGRFDWADAAWLLLTADGPRGEDARRRVARDYYRSRFHATAEREPAA